MVTARVGEVMRGVYLTGHGGYEVLEYRTDIPVPRLAATDVLIRVSAAGVNNTDINTRKAWYSKKGNASNDASWAGAPLQFPRIQGIDACGEIVAVGEEVDPARIGQRVLVEPCLWEYKGEKLTSPYFLGSECDGGFAEYLAIASAHAYAVDCELTDAELASFPCSYSTAENMLTRARVRAGDRVLITGASGGVGSAALQLAKVRGAEVVAVTSGKKVQELKDLGADETVLRGSSLIEQLGENSVDVVLDLVAGEQWGELLTLLKPQGRYAVSGAVGGPLVTLDVRTLYLKDLTFFGCTALEPEVFANLVNIVEKGKIKPLVARTFPLEQIREAQEFFAGKAYTGKIVLTI